MDRRTFVGAVVGALLASPLAATAQQAEKVPRIGFLSLNSAEELQPRLAAFRQGLRERGWVEGRNVLLESRFAAGKVDQLPALVAELIRLKVDIIVTTSSATTWAAKDATKSIPIVMAVSADALGEGLVTSLAHPGGNITGMTFLVGPEIAGKHLELLKEVAPAASRVGVLTNPTNRSHATLTRELKAAARAFGVQLQVLDARSPDQLDSAFAAMTRERAAALLVLTDSMFVGQPRRIADLAARSRLPAMYYQREFVDAGGLISYGASLSDMFRRAATHVDKVLRGAKPSDIPIEQPTKFELVINLKTAKALGITIPQSLLLRADEVIQ
jgi:putative tryptophan/tyrosine transport system substrate-binding protein